jgi:hypothetical protein
MNACGGDEGTAGGSSDGGGGALALAPGLACAVAISPSSPGSWLSTGGGSAIGAIGVSIAFTATGVERGDRTTADGRYTPDVGSPRRSTVPHSSALPPASGWAAFPLSSGFEVGSAGSPVSASCARDDFAAPSGSNAVGTACALERCASLLDAARASFAFALRGFALEAGLPASRLASGRGDRLLALDRASAPVLARPRARSVRDAEVGEELAIVSACSIGPADTGSGSSVAEAGSADMSSTS